MVRISVAVLTTCCSFVVVKKTVVQLMLSLFFSQIVKTYYLKYYLNMFNLTVQTTTVETEAKSKLY